MSPLANAILGVLFLLAGGVGTGLMLYLRGSTRRAASPADSPPASPTQSRVMPSAAPEPAGDDPGPWHRTHDEREEYMDAIHQIAVTGESLTEPMRTGKPTPSWDALLLKGAQLATLPLNEDESVQTRTVIGPAAAKPLVVETPILISHMSYGALSRNIKVALAKGSAAAGTALGSGEGGLLEDEFAAAHRFILEYVPNQYSITDANLRRVDAVEIKFGQSAKPGMGGHLPASKVTEEIAAVRNRPVGQPIVSPARFADVRSRDDLRRTVDSLRTRTEGRPIGIKIAAGQLEADLAFALAAGPDFITIDGRAGGTGSAPRFVKDATSIPTLYALCRARQWLDAQQAGTVSLVVTGGLRVSPDFAKALALGADAVAIGTAALIACGCQQYRICHTGKCPMGITTHDPDLTQRLQVDTSAQYLANFLRVCTEELQTFARLTGHDDVHKLSVADLCTTSWDISQSTVIEHV